MNKLNITVQKESGEIVTLETEVSTHTSPPILRLPLSRSSAYTSTFQHLPDEVILNYILPFSTPSDICTLSRVNKRFQIVCNDRNLWKNLLEKNKYFDETHQMSLMWMKKYLDGNTTDSQISLTSEYCTWVSRFNQCRQVPIDTYFAKQL